MSQSPFITYDELYEILHKKYNATHDEVEYWVNYQQNFGYNNKIHHSTLHRFCGGNTLIPFSYDIRDAEGMYCVNFSPIYSFYLLFSADDYIPPYHKRFVYIRDLSGKRNWSSHLRSDTNLYSDFPALDEASREGLIRFYDKDKKEFTFKKHFKMGENQSDVLWINTTEGQEYLSQPGSFFLLEDIIKIERIFFNKPREECLKELGIEE